MRSMKNKALESQLFRDGLLLTTAIVWGSGFPITNLVVTSGVTPIMLIAIRFLIGAGIVGVILRKELPFLTKQDVRYGVTAGMLLGLAFIVQTYGIIYTSTSNSAFLTSSNVILVPFISWFVFRQRPSLKIVLLAALCFMGMAILSWSPDLGLNFNIGDILTLLSAVGFASHISYLGHVMPKINSPAVLNFIQLLTSGILGISVFLVMEAASFVYKPSMLIGLLASVYLATFPTAVCFFMQTWVQKHSPPARVAVILSLEGFFGSLLAVLVGYDEMTSKLLIGGGIIVLSVILTEVNFAHVIEKFKTRTEEIGDE